MDLERADAHRATGPAFFGDFHWMPELLGALEDVVGPLMSPALIAGMFSENWRAWRIRSGPRSSVVGVGRRVAAAEVGRRRP